MYYYKRNHEYFVYVYDNNVEFLRRDAEEVKKALGKKIKIRYAIVKPSPSKNYYRLQFTSKEVYMYIAKLLRERPKRLTKNFVRGLMDAEGTVYADRKGRVAFELGITKPEIAVKVAAWLRKKGINATVTVHNDRRGRRKTLYKVRVRGWDNVSKLFDELKPMHPKLIEKFKHLQKIHGRASPTPPSLNGAARPLKGNVSWV